MVLPMVEETPADCWRRRLCKETPL